MKFHNVVSEHGCEGQRTKALHEGDEAGGANGGNLPVQRPIQRVVSVGRRLRHQDATGLVLEEVMRSNIGHDLGAGQDFDAELLLDLVELLAGCQMMESGMDGEALPWRSNFHP